MKFSLDRIIIKNRSPFQNDLDLSFKENGIIGAFTGGLKASSGGIAAAIFFGYIASLI